MLGRLSRNGEDSDPVLFNELLYTGEFILKFTTAAFVAAIEDDRQQNRYRLLHGLIRANGVGDWSRALDETLSGLASQELASDFSDLRRVFTERVGKGSWQHEVVRDIQAVLDLVYDGSQPLGEKVSLRTWFQSFVELRNKTRGHGAPTPGTCAKIVPKLKDSISLLVENNPIFKLPWAYLHRNLSGKYRVVELGGGCNVFAKLKAGSAINGENYPDGIYLSAGGHRRVELVHTDLDISDFFFPNGAYTGETYELHSLITDSRLKGDATPYMAVPSDRPPSETEGRGELDVVGHVFTNLPTVRPDYVPRPELEAEIRKVIINDRHPIVTLVGRGGIGKTSLALATLREIADTDRYDVIVWFSARDIDLLTSGAKPVQPEVLTDREIAGKYLALIGHQPTEGGKKINPTAIMAKHLHESPQGPTLFVFDNFETIRSPIDLFNWIDANIRLPNKAVITTRFRDFKADYPIEVSGMEPEEAESLVVQTAISLGIDYLIGSKERDTIINDANAHPYVIKIMLGEIANTGHFSKPVNLIARKEEILDALFERTYANLSPIASRIFLTLCGWRSLVPQIAVEAVLLRHGGEIIDPEGGIDQLTRMSLVERIPAADGADFLEVPFTAGIFGKRKLEVSPIRALIESDIRFLQDIGPTAVSGLKDGIGPRVQIFFRKAARRISEKSSSIEEMRSVLEFLARRHPPAWLLLSELEQEVAHQDSNANAMEYIRRYLETRPSGVEAQTAWRRLFILYKKTGDVIASCGAFLKLAETAEPSIDELSTMANWLNTDQEVKQVMDASERSSLFKPLASLMEVRLSELSANDISRLAWLYLHSGDDIRALDLAERGLKREVGNMHCQKLVEKLANYN
tara:strand:- start:151303 stop:153888 length:2586 start_codon:yes stop_codon:yes gene_type:complete